MPEKETFDERLLIMFEIIGLVFTIDVLLVLPVLFGLFLLAGFFYTVGVVEPEIFPRKTDFCEIGLNIYEAWVILLI